MTCAISGKSRSGPRNTRISGVAIWVVAADDEVFVCWARGSKGRWYRDIATGESAILEFDGRWLVVQAVPVSDADAIARASREYLRKYETKS